MKIKVLEIYKVEDNICLGWEDVNEEWTIETIREFLSQEKRHNRVCLDTGSTWAGKDYSFDTFNEEFPQKEKEVMISNPVMKKQLKKDLAYIERYEDEPEIEIKLAHTPSDEYDEDAWYLTCTVWVNGEFGENGDDYMDYFMVECATEEEIIKIKNRCANYLRKDEEIAQYLEVIKESI